jgi:hypothetical protein
MRTALLLLTAWFIAGCGNTPAHADAIEAKTLLRTQVAWDQTPYTTYPSGRPELSLMKIRIPARTTMDWHCHLAPMPATCSLDRSKSRTLLAYG